MTQVERDNPGVIVFPPLIPLAALLLGLLLDWLAPGYFLRVFLTIDERLFLGGEKCAASNDERENDASCFHGGVRLGETKRFVWPRVSAGKLRDLGSGRRARGHYRLFRVFLCGSL